jgi:hypothetical protein
MEPINARVKNKTGNTSTPPCAPVACYLIKNCDNIPRKNLIHIQTVNMLACGENGTAAVTITACHCYYIITFRKTSKAG